MKRASLAAQIVKNLPAVQKTPVQFLGQETPLEKGKATQSSILAWRIPGIYSPRGRKESDTTEFKHTAHSVLQLLGSFITHHSFKHYLYLCSTFLYIL